MENTALAQQRQVGSLQVTFTTEPAGGEVVSHWFPGSILQAAGNQRRLERTRHPERDKGTKGEPRALESEAAFQGQMPTFCLLSPLRLEVAGEGD